MARRYGIVVDDLRSSLTGEWFGGWAKNDTGVEFARLSRFGGGYKFQMPPDFQFPRTRALKEALMLAVKRPEFLGRVRLVKLKGLP